MNTAAQQQGFNIAEYSAKRDAKSLRLLAGIEGNFILTSVQYDPSTGLPGQPTTINVSRGMLDETEKGLVAQEAEIVVVRKQLATIRADMDALAPAA